MDNQEHTCCRSCHLGALRIRNCITYNPLIVRDNYFILHLEYLSPDTWILLTRFTDAYVWLSLDVLQIVDTHRQEKLQRTEVVHVNSCVNLIEPRAFKNAAQ